MTITSGFFAFSGVFLTSEDFLSVVTNFDFLGTILTGVIFFNDLDLGLITIGFLTAFLEVFSVSSFRAFSEKISASVLS